MSPAVLTSIGLACQGKPGSSVVVCTEDFTKIMTQLLNLQKALAWAEI